MAETRVLLVEDHKLFAESLASVLRQWREGLCLHHAYDLGSLEQAAGFDPALVVLDWHVPGVETAALALDLAQRQPPVPVLVVTGTVDPAEMTAALDAGVAGFVSKTDGTDTLCAALDAVLAGQTWLDASLARQAAAFRRRRARPELSERQQAVLALMARGHSNTQIGQSLNIRLGTVKTHVAAVLANLGAQNRAEAVYRARAAGLIDGAD